MPSYSFNERFVPYVLNGTKRQTVRKRRLSGNAEPGDSLYLFYGLRTKYCQRLRTEICKDVESIYISEDKVVIFDLLETKYEVAKVKDDPGNHFTAGKIISVYTKVDELDEFAWKDGFRHEGAPLQKAGAFEMLKMYFKKQGQLPFVGDLITW